MAMLGMWTLTQRDETTGEMTALMGTKKVTCSQSQSPVTLNRDTIVPGFVILARQSLEFMCSDTLVNQQTG
jgi:hypothetical protein